MRKVLAAAAMLAIVAIPLIAGNIGFCRSMPCCSQELGARMSAADPSNCCKPSNCAEPPPATRDYTRSIQTPVPSVLLVPAILPTVLTSAPPAIALRAFAPQERQTVHRRIALLSILIV